MRRTTTAAVFCAALIGVSAPSLAQYGGYGPRDGGYGRDGGYDRRGGDYDGGRARGSFYGSCRDVDQRGPSLSAMCRTRDGDWVPARINLERCGGRPIANRDGRLSC